MAYTSYYDKKKEESEKKIQTALEARRKRTSASSSSNSKIETALSARSKRISSDIESIWEDIRERSDAAMNDYKTHTANLWGKSASELQELQREKSIEVSKLLQQVNAYRNYLGKEIADPLIDSLSQVKSGYDSIYSNAKVFSNFKSEDEYKEYQFRSSTDNGDGRQQRYEENLKKIKELEAQRSQATTGDVYNPDSNFMMPIFNPKTRQIDDEIEALKAENLKYERGEDGYISKAIDDHGKVTLNSDFDTRSANRGYSNSSKEDMELADLMNDSTTWYFDADRVYRDAYGNELVLDENGNYYSPAAPKVNVEDKLSLYLNTTEDERVAAAADVSGKMDGTWKSLMREGYEGAWEYLTEQELGIYYYYREESQEMADKYLSDMVVELNRRRTLDQIGQYNKAYDEANFLEKIFLNAGTIPAKFISTATGFIEDSIDTLMGNDINPYSSAHGGMHYSQTIRGNTAEEMDATGFKIPVLDFTLGDIYQTGMSRIDSALATAVFKGGGTVFLGMGAAEEEAYKLYQQGASTEQITLGALSAGAAEAIWEYISYGKLKEIENVGNPGEWVKSVLIQGYNELTEEAATEVSNIISNALIMGGQSDLAELYKENDRNAFYTFLDLVKQTAQAGFGGFLGGLGAGATQANSAYAETKSKYRDAGRTIMGAEGGVDALKQLANDVAGVSDAKMQKTLNKQSGNVSSEVATGKGLVGKAVAGVKNFSNATKVGRLYNTVNTANNLANASANQADIAKSLQRKGFNAETANDIAEALVAEWNGQELNEAQEKLLKSAKESKVVQDAISNIMVNEQSTMGQRSQNIRDFQGDVKAGAIAKVYGVSVDTAKEMLEGKHTSEEKNAPESQYEVSVDGKTIDSKGNVINIVGVESINDGKMVLKTEDGTIDSSEVRYASEADALVYEAVAKMGASPSSAWTMIKAFNEADGITAQAYATAAPLAYLYGKLNYKNGVFKDGKPLLALTEAQSATAFQMGRDDAEASVKTTENASTEATLTEKNADKEIIFEGFTYSKKKANDIQKASMEAIDIINKMSSLEIHVYKSYKKNGKLYAMVNGKERIAPNGYYTDGGKVYVDINAGNMGEGLMLYTLSHEIGHHIARYNAQEFKAISDFLFEHYGENVPIYDLLEAQKRKLKKSYKEDGKQIPNEAQLEKEAHEELVCDMLSRMLADKNAYDKLMEFKQKDLNGFQKLGQAIKKALDKLAKALGIYDKLNPDFAYAASAENIGEEAFRQLQEMYIKAFVQADANFQSAEVKENTTNDGGVMYMSRDIESVTEDTVRSDLTDIFNGNNVTARSYVPLSKTTPFAVRYITGYTTDLPIIVEKKKAYFDMHVDGKFKEDSSHHYHGMGVDGFIDAMEILDNPEYAIQEMSPKGNARYAFISNNENGEEVCIVFEMAVFKPASMMNDYPGGFYNLDITEFVATDEWLEAHGVEAGTSYKDYLLSFDGNNLIYNRDIHLEQLEKARNIEVGSAGLAASHINNRAFDDKLAQNGTTVKSESAEALDLEVDADTESVAPTVLKSERTWSESDYVQEREQAAKEISKAIGVSVKKAKAYIDSVNSIAKMIAEDRVRLDYFSSPGRSSFVGNVEYGGSFDFSTLCKKRRLLTGTFTAIQKALPNTALTADEILKIRNRMKDAGLEVSCGLCYVEGSRANMGQFAKEFLKLYKQYYPDAWQPNMADVNTPDGIEWVRINHPECYEQYEYFWNHYGTLKPGDKNLFASQQKPKLYQLHTEYKGEVLEKFNNDDNVEAKNLNGGIRLQSFSDFEIVHLIDTMQIIMDMSRVGLAGQAYTKVPDFAWALGDTGLKINLSLIAKGVDENGKLIFDDVEGMPIADAMKLRDRYSKNVGTILVAFNDEQLLAAMADERVDYIIPFHRSQWKKSQYGAMGLPAKTKDYTYMQNEKFIKPQYHEYRGRMVQDKATNYMPNEYWDFSKSGKENAEAYLEMCARNNKRPKFYKLLQNNGDGSYSLKADGSTDGYWKLLIDFKMYDNDGNGSPQMPVKPEFNMDEAQRMLNDYQGGHSNFPVAQGIVDSFVEEYKDSHKGALYSDRDNAPTFYSQMAKVVDSVKQEKLGAASVVSMLRGKGVKAEEIKWSGIEAWLEGKKSVTKAELQEFIAGSMLQIEEEVLSNEEVPYTEDQQKRLDEHTAKRDEIVGRLASEWKRITGDEFPIQNVGAGLESSVESHIREANAAQKNATFEYRLLTKLRGDLKEVIERNDDFGFDNWSDALRSIYRHRRDFIPHYEMSNNDKAVIVKFCNALNAYNELPNKISDSDTDKLRSIAHQAEQYNRKIGDVNSEHLSEAAKHRTRWWQYSLTGGENYREILFKIPGSTFYNTAMAMHWEEREGVLAHARIQDLNTFIGKMLFIEEIQSDWHNDGHKDGYAGEEPAVRKKIAELSKQWDELLKESRTASDERADEINEKLDAVYEEKERLKSKMRDGGLAPDAPFRDNYHEYVLKRLIREAAEKDYDSIGWTTAQTQVERWSKKYAEGYRIEYDQDIPKFLNKYGKKWGTQVGKTVLDNGTEVWSMAITDEMKESVMTEGQPLYSDRDSEGNQLSVEQQEFFKDSKVRDAKGNLLKVFHGTPKKFTTFRQGTAEGWGQGIYFTDNIEAAKEFGENIVEAYLNITNPFNVDTMNYNDIDFESTKAYQNFDKKYWQRWYDEYDTYEEYREDGMGVDIDMIYTEYVDVFNQILRELGYDGIIANQSNNIDGYEIVAFHENQPKLTSNTAPTISDDMRYQDRADESVSNRSLLANAFEGLAQNDIEKNKIQEYKGKIDLINSEEKKLSELNQQIKELSFAKGPRDVKAIRDLQFEARQTANRINTYDKQLLRLEASKPLQNVLSREKKRAYQKAEQRGKEALDAYKEKVAETQRELLEKWKGNRKAAVAKARETAEKRNAREKLQKLVLDTTKWLTYPAKTDVKCPDILKKPYSDFLNGIDLSSKRLANGGDPTKNDLRLSNAMDSLATALDKIMTAQDPTQDTDKVLDTGYLDLPADFVMKLRDMNESIKSMMVEGDYVVNSMTAAEVRQLSQMIRTLNHAIKTMSNLYANLRFANVEALGFDTMEFMDALGEIEKTSGMKDFVQWDNALPYYAFKRFGKGGESVFEGLMDAQDKLAFLAKEIFAFQEKTWTGKEAKEWSEDTHTITLPNGNELTLTTADAMSIYCLSRREQGLQHLLGGGTRVMGLQKGSQKAKDSRSMLTIEDVSAIISTLTDRQKQVAEGIQEFMSTVCSEWGNEISMKRFLTRDFAEKFYFPIESNDENLPTKDPAAQQSDLFRLLNISATKPLTPGANNEVIIRNVFDVFTGHASDMARLNAYGMALLDYMKWLNYREKTVTDEGQVNVKGVRKSMEKAYGNAAKSYVLNLVKDVNGRPSDGGDPNILMKWMRAGKTASVGSSLRVATLQITSYPRAALVLSPKSLALGLSKLPQIEKAKKYCGIALWKSFGFYDTNISRSIEDQMKGVTDVKQKLIELSLKGAEWGDAITWGALWNACEYEVAKTTKNKVGSEEFYQEVGNKLREVVYRTQVVDSTLTRSQIMRSKRGMAQEAAAFMSEPTLSANILMDAGFEFNAEKRRTGSANAAWKKTGTYVCRAVAVYAIGQLTAALMEGLWDAWRDDDDDEFDKKFIDAFVENLVLDLAPFNKIPIVSDVFEAALSMFGIGFYSSDKMSTTWLTQAVSAVDAWKDALSGKSSVTVYGALYKTTRAISSFFGVSVSGVMRETVALWNNTAGAYDPTLKILTYGRSKGDIGGLLLDAHIKGDDRQVESYRAEFADEDAYQSAVRTAIKDRYDAGEINSTTAEQYLVKFGGLEDDDAYWKVEEWKYETETGDDFKKYNDFYTAVQTGKDLKAVIKRYTDNGVEAKTLASQITSYFKPMYKEMSNTERAAIKGYLLNAYQLLGYNRTEKSKDIDKWLKD